MGEVRPPAVAGTFYPADPQALTALVDTLLDDAVTSIREASAERGGIGRENIDDPVGRGYVVPHAGLRYSGPTAARVYARLRAAGAGIKRVILVGPAHRVPLRGCAVPTSSRWLTPLGEVAIDTGGVAALIAAGLAVSDDAAHAPEHSLEVQLPFLQRALGPSVPVLPIVTGYSTVDHVARVVTAARGEAAGTVVLCSTDLSHYLDEASAQRRDARTVRAVLGLAPEAIGVRDACGVFALRGLVAWAAQEGIRPSLLHLTTSAQTSGDRTRVVGYSAFVLR